MAWKISRTQTNVERVPMSNSERSSGKRAKNKSAYISEGGERLSREKRCNTVFVRSASSVRSFPLSRTYEGCWGGWGREGGGGVRWLWFGRRKQSSWSSGISQSPCREGSSAQRGTATEAESQVCLQWPRRIVQACLNTQTVPTYIMKLHCLLLWKKDLLNVKYWICAFYIFANLT